MPSESEPISQDEIEQLLRQAQGEAPPASPQPSDARDEHPADAAQANAPQVGDADIQALLDQAEQAIASVDDPVAAALDGLEPFEFTDFSAAPANTEQATLDLLSDVELDLKIELGRTHMHLENVLKLHNGSVVALDKLAGDPVDIFAKGRLVARGEVLVLNENFCVRVSELVSGDAA